MKAARPRSGQERKAPYETRVEIAVNVFAAQLLPGVTDMHMNHINLCVSDVPKSRAFFQRYFGYRLLVEKGADQFVGLVDDGGMVLAISNFSHATSVQYPPLFHVGFFLDTDEEVNAVHERLTADGFKPGNPEHFHGAWTFYVDAPGGGTVEVAHQGPGFE